MKCVCIYSYSNKSAVFTKGLFYEYQTETHDGKQFYLVSDDNNKYLEFTDVPFKRLFDTQQEHRDKLINELI